MITLTLLHKEIPLGKQITRIWRCFASLRKEGCWERYVSGFVAFLEIKPNPRTKCWHVHLHIIAEGLYIPQRELSTDWKVATGDSYIVDVQKKGTAESMALYGAKYASKPLDAGSMETVEQFTEAIIGIGKRRLWLIGGSWKGRLQLLAKGIDPKDWEHIESANALFTRAASGDKTAVRIVELYRTGKLDEDWTATEHGPSPP